MSNYVLKKYPTGHAELKSEGKMFEKGDIIDTDQGSYIVINYYYTSNGIVYEGWSETEYLKGKKLN